MEDSLGYLDTKANLNYVIGEHQRNQIKTGISYDRNANLVNLLLESRGGKLNGQVI
jgi:hypothetical protein